MSTTLPLPATDREWPHLVIRASAGTGKTFQLSNRYLELLAAEIPGEQILATTFTRKAAGEILDRVLFRLAEAAHDNKALAQLGKFIAGGDFTRDECLALLEQTTRNIHRLRVGTLDSFFMAIAGSFSLELGLPSGWTIADEATDQRLRAQAIQATLAQDATSDLLTLFHLLTKADTTRSISRVVREAVDDLYGMFLETTPDAWRQLKRYTGLDQREIDSLITEIACYPLAGELEKKRDASLEIARLGDWERFIEIGLPKKILLGETIFNRKQIPLDLIALYERLLSHAKAVFINPVVGHNEGTFQLLEKFHGEYVRLKQRHRVLRFDDVTRLVGQSAQVADSQRLGYRLDGGLKHLLLDEFQDTSLAQWNVLRPIAHEVTDAPRGTSSFFCVGDVKQAIYGWRGGLAQIFDAVDSELSSLEHLDLVQSFRSSQPVIDAVNQIFLNLAKHNNLGDHEDTVRAWQQRFVRHTTAKAHLPGYAALRVLPDFNDEHEPDDARDDYVAQYVKDLLAASPGRNICVLTRRNEMVRRLVFALREIGVDASEEGGNRLTDSAAVGLLLSLLQFADHPGDTVARYHIARSPLAPLLGYTHHADDIAAAAFSANLRQELVRDGLGPVVLRWSKLLAPQCNRRELSRLDQLVALAYQYAGGDSLRTSDFIDFVERQPLSDPTTAPVRVMNIHQAKGLQFDIVVLPELDARLSGQNDPFVAGRPTPTSPVNAVCRYVDKDHWPFLPERFQSMFKEAVEQHWAESLCVMYVAATRAIHAMHLLIGAEEGASASPHKTFAGLIRGALCNNQVLAADTLAYEVGDCDWPLQLIDASDDREAEAAAQPPALFRVQLAQGKRERGWQNISPSRLEGGATRKISDVFRPARTQAQDFGTLVHLWLSQVNWLEDGVPSDAALTKMAVAEVGWIGETREQIATFRGWLAQPALKKLLTKKEFNLDVLAPADALQVANERRFALRWDGQLMTGSIDRLVLYECDGKIVAADIVDFKTDHLEASDKQALEDKTEFYRPQLAAYAEAVRRVYGLTAAQTRARLVFLATGDIVTTEGKATHEVPARGGRPHRQPTQRTLF